MRVQFTSVCNQCLCLALFLHPNTPLLALLFTFTLIYLYSWFRSLPNRLAHCIWICIFGLFTLLHHWVCGTLVRCGFCGLQFTFQFTIWVFTLAISACAWLVVTSWYSTFCLFANFSLVSVTASTDNGFTILGFRLIDVLSAIQVDLGLCTIPSLCSS